MSLVVNATAIFANRNFKDIFIKDMTETSIKLETLMNEITNEFDETDKAKRLKTLFKLKDDGNSNLYYEEINRMTEALKDEYREIVLKHEVEHGNQ